MIAGAERISPEHPGAGALRAAVPAQIGHSRGVLIERTPVGGTRSGCTLLNPQDSEGVAVVSVAPAHALYLSMRGSGQVTIYLRRLAAHAPLRALGVLPAGSPPALLSFPADSSTLPWHVRLVPTTPTAICLV